MKAISRQLPRDGGLKVADLRWCRVGGSMGWEMVASRWQLNEMIKACVNEITCGSARCSSVSAFMPQRNDLIEMYLPRHSSI